MTKFVHCRGCAAQIHETAITCPKCGATQGVPAAVSLPLMATAAGGTQAASGYDQVKWYRRRWFTVMCLLTVSPIAAMLIFTGPIYFLAKREVRVLPKSLRLAFSLLSLGWIYQFFSPPNSSATASYSLLAIGMALLIGLRNGFPQEE